MSNKNEYFILNKVRSSATAKSEIVLQGYAVDGYLDNLRIRGAIFAGGKPCKSLHCRLEQIKLPPIRVIRRHGDTMSHYAVIYVDLSRIIDAEFYSLGNSAKLVVIGEKPDGKRTMLYKQSLKNVKDTMGTFDFEVDKAYLQDGKTILEGWQSGGEGAVIKIADAAKIHSPFNYKVSFCIRDDVLLEYPECEPQTPMGYKIELEGEYEKLRLAMSDSYRKGSQIVTVDASGTGNKGFSNISRYSEKVVRNLKDYGMKETMQKIKLRMSPGYISLNKSYPKWLEKFSPTEEELEAQRSKNFEFRPLFSFLVPLYETEEKYLIELIEALKKQTYSNWEVCFSDGSTDSSRLSEIIGRYSADDERIRYVAEAPGPLGISSNTNQAFSIAKGDFIVLGDHDDLITPDALYECAKAMNESIVNDGSKIDTDLDVIYTNEDKTDSSGKRRFEPNIKPDFNKELLESCNYITHMFVVRKTLVEEVGLFDDTYNGAQDYDFILRCTEKAEKIHHINKIVYSWRINETSTAGNPAAKMYAYDAGAKALQAHYDRVGVKARAEIGDHLGYYHTVYDVPKDSKTYVVVINADEDSRFNATVDSIKFKSDYKSLEFIRIASKDCSTLADQLNAGVKQVEVMLKDSGFIEDKASAEDRIFVCFVDAGVTMMGESDLSNMLGYLANRENVGAIGGKIYIPGGTISHAGVILNMKNIHGYMYLRHSGFEELYFNYSAYSALREGVTLFRLKDLHRFGGFDAKYMGETTIVDYTYKMSKEGQISIYDANANFMAKHRPGKTTETSSVTKKDVDTLMKNHPEVADKGDIYYK